MTVEKVHVKALWIAAIAGAVASAPIGWLTASFEMGQTVAVNTAKIAQMQKDILALKEADKAFVPKEQFAQFVEEWKLQAGETHDFQVREDSRSDEIIREHAKLAALIEQTHPQAFKKPMSSDLPSGYDPNFHRR